MTDKFSKKVRSRIMSKVRSKNTKPETKVRSYLHQHGFRFRLHRNDLPGKPDIVLPKYRTVIFVHGCFWHQHKNCKLAKIPHSNLEYWIPKLKRNRNRDEINEALLKKIGWIVEIIWECEVESIKLKKIVKTIRHNYKS